MEATTQGTTSDVTTGTSVATDGKEAVAQDTKESTPEKKMYKGKINGREVEVDEDTLVKNWQKYEAADERFRKAAEIEKKYRKYEDLDKAFQEKDLSVLSKYIDPETLRQFSEKQLLEWLEYQGLSDEQKELLEAKKKLKEFEDEKTEAEKRREEAERLQVNQQAVQLLDQEIANTFTELGVKPTPAKIMRMAMHMEAGLSQNPPVFISGKEAYQRAIKDLRTDLSGYLESVDEKELLDFLPKRVLDAVRKRSLEDVQAPFAHSRRQESQEPKSNGKIRATTDDFFKTLDQKYQRR